MAESQSETRPVAFSWKISVRYLFKVHMKRKRYLPFSCVFLNLSYCASFTGEKWGLCKHLDIPFYWIKVEPISGKTWDKSLGPSDVISCAKHSRSSQQPSDWEFQKNFKISPKKQQEILPPPLFPTARTSLEDRPPRKGDFSIRLFVVELFAVIDTASAMSPLLTDISFWVVASKIEP